MKNFTLGNFKIFKNKKKKRTLRGNVLSGWKISVHMFLIAVIIMCAESYYVFYRVNNDKFVANEEVEVLNYKPLNKSDFSEVVRFYDERVRSDMEVVGE